jgi:hypothetical protein
MNKKYLCENFLENDLDHLSIVLDLSRAFSQQSFCYIFLYFHFSNFFLLLLQTEIRTERSNLRKKKKLRLSEKISFQPLTENNDSALIPLRDKMNAVKFSFGPFDEKKMKNTF